MAGIYIHIPFCKQACTYCNFHFSTSLSRKSNLIDAICAEIELRQTEWNHLPIKTIYLGGGTPSLCTADELLMIFEILNKYYDLSEIEEVTLEANPDDLTLSYLNQLKKTPINRLSIGIQSFREADLVFMNRAHNAMEADRSIQLAQDVGFESLTIDLIYGIPGLSDRDWIKNLVKAMRYNINHLSCYALTLEPKTALYHQVKTGQVQAPDSDQAAGQFELLMDFAQSNELIHYEISNFARSGHYAKHNTNYWFGAPYLGLGPSAHSYNGKIRWWNVANNNAYIKQISSGELPSESESLTTKDKYNEWILTRLRTIWGLKMDDVESLQPDFKVHFEAALKPLVQGALIINDGDKYILSRRGKLIADQVAADLFITD